MPNEKYSSIPIITNVCKQKFREILDIYDGTYACSSSWQFLKKPFLSKKIASGD